MAVSGAWGEYEIKYLKKQYGEGLSTTTEIAKVLGRSVQGVRAKASKLGLVWRGNVVIPDGYQFCTKCRGVYPIGEFASDKSRPSGYNIYCRTCTKVLYKEKTDKKKESLKHMELPTHITCNRCKQEKPIDSFWRNNGGTYGRKTVCIECVRTQRKQDKLKKEQED